MNTNAILKEMREDLEMNEARWGSMLLITGIKGIKVDDIKLKQELKVAGASADITAKVKPLPEPHVALRRAVEKSRKGAREVEWDGANKVVQMRWRRIGTHGSILSYGLIVFTGDAESRDIDAEPVCTIHVPANGLGGIGTEIKTNDWHKDLQEEVDKVISDYHSLRGYLNSTDMRQFINDCVGIEKGIQVQGTTAYVLKKDHDAKVIQLLKGPLSECGYTITANQIVDPYDIGQQRRPVRDGLLGRIQLLVESAQKSFNDSLDGKKVHPNTFVERMSDLNKMKAESAMFDDLLGDLVVDVKKVFKVAEDQIKELTVAALT